MWVGSDKELNEWLPPNTLEVSPSKINFSVEKFFIAKIYVHQTKIRPGIDKSGLCDPKLVVFYQNLSVKTKVVNSSLSAVFNEVLEINNLKLFDIGITNYFQYPNLMLCLYDEDKKKVIVNLIGFMQIIIITF